MGTLCLRDGHIFAAPRTSQASSRLHTFAHAVRLSEAFLHCSPSAFILGNCSSSLSSSPLIMGVHAPLGHLQSTCAVPLKGWSHQPQASQKAFVLMNSWLCLTFPRPHYSLSRARYQAWPRGWCSTPEVLSKGWTAALGAIPTDTGRGLSGECLVTTLAGRDWWSRSKEQACRSCDSSFTPKDRRVYYNSEPLSPRCWPPVWKTRRPAVLYGSSLQCASRVLPFLQMEAW